MNPGNRIVDCGAKSCGEGKSAPGDERSRTKGPQSKRGFFYYWSLQTKRGK